MRYDLRFELFGLHHRDIGIGAPSLDAAKAAGERIIVEAYGSVADNFDWRGAVCFVACKPAEESHMTVDLSRTPLGGVLYRKVQ